MMIIAGVEEAGRGPVIGPMVMAICAINKEEEYKLKNMGVKDSKLLTPNQREDMFEQIKEMTTHAIIILQPKDIDNALNDPAMNLNKLEAVTTSKLINSISKAKKPDEIILDCPSNNIPVYEQYVRAKLEDQKQKLIPEHKADLNHIIVGAASILAKVTRDREIEKIKQQIGLNFGSGYPSDPTTISFLNQNWKTHEKIFRKTWKTYQKVANKHKQKGLGDF
ncbi:ribonuclease HII [Candidatus Woesearchaeota archaeon]|nr:ribonuclease HII [Candidatus Woesearchaeota archaeon]